MAPGIRAVAVGLLFAGVWLRAGPSAAPVQTGGPQPDPAGVKAVFEKFKGTHDLAGAAEALAKLPTHPFIYSYTPQPGQVEFTAFTNADQLYGAQSMICYEFVHYAAYAASDQNVSNTMSGNVQSSTPQIGASASSAYDWKTATKWDGKSNIPRGKVIVFKARAFNNTAGYYHIGVSLGNGLIAHNSSSGNLQISKVSDVDSIGYNEILIADYKWTNAGDKSPEVKAAEKAEQEAKAKLGGGGTGTSATGTGATGTSATGTGGTGTGGTGTGTSNGGGTSSGAGASGSGGASGGGPGLKEEYLDDLLKELDDAFRDALDQSEQGFRWMAPNNCCGGDPLGTLYQPALGVMFDGPQYFTIGEEVDVDVDEADDAPAFNPGMGKLDMPDWKSGLGRLFVTLLGPQRLLASPLLPGFVQDPALAAQGHKVRMARQTPPPTFALIATGSGGADTFTLKVMGARGMRGHLLAPDGLVLEPLNVKAPASLMVERAGVRTKTVSAFCSDFAKPLPAAGTMYRVAPSAVQQRLKPMRYLVRAADRLASRNQLHPDGDPADYLHSIKQYSVWARRERWDQKKFAASFLEKTKQNATTMKIAWTKEIEAAVLDAAPRRWRDVEAIGREADALATRPVRR